MNQFDEKCKVHYLAATTLPEKNQVCINSVGMFIWTEQHEKIDVINTLAEYKNTQPQLIYITSSEKIFECDWVYVNGLIGIYVPDPKNKTHDVQTLDGKIIPFTTTEYFEKIIGTTDKRVGVNYLSTRDKFFPRPSNKFLSKFCELGGIEEVLVEYKQEIHLFGEHKDFKYVPKIAEDGTLTIKSIFDTFSEYSILEIIKQESIRANVRQFTNVNNWGFSQFERNIASRVFKLANRQLDDTYTKEQLIEIISKLIHQVHTAEIVFSDHYIDFKISPVAWVNKNVK